MNAKFIQDGYSIDYTPTADTPAGTIIIQNGLAGVTKVDIPAGTLGSLATCGVFDVTKDDDAEFEAGDNVYWNAEDETATDDHSDALLGLAIAPAGETDGTVRVLLNSAFDDNNWVPTTGQKIPDVESAGTDSIHIIQALNKVLTTLRANRMIALA